MRTDALASGCLFVVTLTAHATQVPAAAGHDARIRRIDYVADEVTVVAVQRGMVTRILLGEDEVIARDGAATGFPADCSKPEYAWCMHARPGSNQILVKPKEGATINNLELHTNKRDYSFRFEVAADNVHTRKSGISATTTASEVPVYRLTFQYPAAPLPSAGVASATQAPLPAELTRAAHVVPRNWQYSMQVLTGGDDIVPDLVFDDGRFTYFQFSANREVPTIFAVTPAGEEARINFHVDQHDPGLIVVERMSRRFVLRLGDAVIGIWNDAFDSYGVGPANGTTIDGLVRTIR